MTDKDEIKFAIRYLKKGLKSKRTPPLYEELMNKLGFEKKKERRISKNIVKNIRNILGRMQEIIIVKNVVYHHWKIKYNNHLGA